jgi:hypothetical protein
MPLACHGPIFLALTLGPDPGYRRGLNSLLGKLRLGPTQAENLGVKPGIQQSPLLELCCQRMSAKTSYRQAARDIDLLTGVSVSAKTQERIVNRTPIETPEITEPVTEVDLDGGMVRLVGDPGQPSEWKQYKAVRVNGDGPGMAWFQDNSALLDWLHHLSFVSLFYC